MDFSVLSSMQVSNGVLSNNKKIQFLIKKQLNNLEKEREH